MVHNQNSVIERISSFEFEEFFNGHYSEEPLFFDGQDKERTKNELSMVQDQIERISAFEFEEFFNGHYSEEPLFFDGQYKERTKNELSMVQDQIERISSLDEFINGLYSEEPLDFDGQDKEMTKNELNMVLDQMTPMIRARCLRVAPPIVQEEVIPPTVQEEVASPLTQIFELLRDMRESQRVHAEAPREQGQRIQQLLDLVHTRGVPIGQAPAQRGSSSHPAPDRAEVHITQIDHLDAAYAEFLRDWVLL